MTDVMNSLDGYLLVQLNYPIDHFEFLARRLVPWVNFECLLKLMPRAQVVPMIPQDEPPYDPVIRVPGPARRLLNPFLNLFDGLGHLALFEESEGPMTVARCIGIFRGAMEFGLPAHVYSLWVELVQIEQKCEVAVSVRETCRVEPDAPSPVLHRRIVELQLKIG